MKHVIMMIIALFAITAHAEWYYVTSVTSYNKISAHLADAAAEKKEILIRIENLENIEDIRDDRKKVLLGGAAPAQLAKEILLNQVVWIDQLRVQNGENVANVYPTYNRVLRAFTARRQGGTFSISPDVKEKVERIYSRMLAKLGSETPDRNQNNKNSSDVSTGSNQARTLGWYENEYSRALFIYDALNWFKNEGQYLPEQVQGLYTDWLIGYQNATGSEALFLEIKIMDMQKRFDLYRDFLFD